MIMQLRNFAAVIVAALVFGQGVAAQTGIPDSLRYLRLPDDPDSMPHYIAEGKRSVQEIFQVGCPADGGWPEAAYNAVLRVAETDFETRLAVARGFSSVYREVCPTDLWSMESWMVEELLAEYRAGLLGEWKGQDVLWGRVLSMFHYPGWPVQPATYAALRTIACDTSVSMVARESAAGGMESFRVHVYGETREAAREAIIGDIGFAEELMREDIVFDTRTRRTEYWTAPGCDSLPSL